MAKSIIDYITLVLLVVGGLNWGLVGAFQVDLVKLLFGAVPILQNLVYILVGVSAIVQLVLLFQNKN